MLASIISKYLQENRRLIIPQLGAFLVKEPGRVVLFSQLLTKDDGVLHNLLIENGLSDIGASGLINRLLFDVRYIIENGGEYTLEGVGLFSVKENGVLHFEYNSKIVETPVVSEPEQSILIKEDKVSEILEPIDNVQTVEATETEQTEDVIETIEEIEAIEKLEEAETIERIEEVEKFEEIETIEKVEEVEKLKEIETIEKVEEVEKLKEIETIEKVDEVETFEETETIEKVDEIETFEEIKTIEKFEEVEEVEKNETTEEIDTTAIEINYENIEATQIEQDKISEPLQPAEEPKNPVFEQYPDLKGLSYAGNRRPRHSNTNRGIDWWMVLAVTSALLALSVILYGYLSDRAQNRASFSALTEQSAE